MRRLVAGHAGIGSGLALDSGIPTELGALSIPQGCAANPLVVGARGLAEASERQGFLAADFRGSLLLLVVLALADSQSFVLFVLLDEKAATTALLAPAALAYAIGFVSLYRLQTWGAWLNALTSAVVLVGAALRRMDPELRVS